jgi:hypothetical protein
MFKSEYKIQGHFENQLQFKLQVRIRYIPGTGHASSRKAYWQTMLRDLTGGTRVPRSRVNRLLQGLWTGQ